MANSFSDRFGRKIDYLRISVTDRCNLRCVYCMPPEGIELFEKNEILTFEEMERFSRVAINLGVRKIKLTGGEPLVRKGIVDFIASISKIEGLEDLSLTTNGIFLEGFAEDLKASGLNRVNVSLDSLDPKRYGEITRGGNLSSVLCGINKALKVGFKVKVNTVVLGGLSEKEIFELIEFGKEKGIEVRFITTISEPFCSSCSRLRLTARGTLRPCLFSTLEIDVFPLLRKVAPDEEIEKAIRKAVFMKPEWNPVLSGLEDPKKVFIRNIGG